MRASGLGHTIKDAAFTLADTLRLNDAAMRTPWRRNRLLILCYHGISIDDEHEWDPELYMSAGALRRRLELIARAGCSVLPLDAALDKLDRGTLPPRSVVLTFDDGTYDFYARACPIIASFDFPVTVYFTTCYATFNRPVYNPMCSYLLWKARGRVLQWTEVIGDHRRLVLDDVGRRAARGRLTRFPIDRGLSGADKDELLGELARRLQIDYDRLLRRRILHLMTIDEAAALAKRGVDFQLHTHRHAVSRHRDAFEREILDNRDRLQAVRTSNAVHFCYPSGAYREEFVPWLRAWNVTSATTCNPGLASRPDEPLLLPRFVDSERRSEAEFRCWLSGLAAFVPARPRVST